MPKLPHGYTLHRAIPTADIDTVSLYRLLALRQEVFVLEQDCVYLDLDGRDLEPTTRQFWITDIDGKVAATSRVLEESAEEPRLMSIGRVVTAPRHRGLGLSGILLEEAIAWCGDAPIVLHAQAHLAFWYARYGFRPVGEGFLEDGIPHQLMRLEA